MCALGLRGGALDLGAVRALEELVGALGQLAQVGREAPSSWSA